MGNRAVTQRGNYQQTVIAAKSLMIAGKLLLMPKNNKLLPTRNEKVRYGKQK